MNDPQQNRCPDDCLPGIAVAKNNRAGRVGEEAQRRKHDNQIGDVGDNRAKPVAPGGAKAHQLAESFARVGKDTAVEVGANAGQQEHGEGEE